VVPIDERPALPQGSTLAVIDLTIDDPPSDKGKQKADIEMVDAPDQPGTSITSGDNVAKVSTRWPDFRGASACMGRGGVPTLGSVDLRVQGCI
jgi:hypothetical protein